jgi:hypothetical protein
MGGSIKLARPLRLAIRLFSLYRLGNRISEIIVIALVPFGRKFSTNNRVDVKKIVTIVFLAEIFCLILGTTSLAEIENIESLYAV